MRDSEALEILKKRLNREIEVAGSVWIEWQLFKAIDPTGFKLMISEIGRE